MTEMTSISDAYIDEIIQSAGTYNPALKETQGVKLRELIKRLRDQAEQAPRLFTYTTSGNGVMTQFSVPHGLTSPKTVVIYPNSPDAIGMGATSDVYAYIEGANIIIRSRQTSSSFASGTNNLTWSLMVR